MDIFFLTLTTGMATGFALELLTTILGKIIPARILRIALVIPISTTAAYFLGVASPILWVVSAASAFISLVVLRWLDKPVTIQNIRR